jgi:hypothetical protein
MHKQDGHGYNIFYVNVCTNSREYDNVGTNL